MKISKFITFILDHERKVYVILFILFSLGFIYGCYFSFNGKAGELETVFDKSNEFNTWVSIVLKESICIIFTFILGYTVIGAPFLCVNIILYGMYLGIALSGYMDIYGIKGSFIVSFLLFPYYFILINSLILLTFSSLRMSVALFNVFKNGTRFISPKIYSVPHIVKCLVFLLVNFVFSFIYSNFVYPIVTKFL